jgi:hypothetical protein
MMPRRCIADAGGEAAASFRRDSGSAVQRFMAEVLPKSSEDARLMAGQLISAT